MRSFMDGCKVIALSGINGNFGDFVNCIEPYLNCSDLIKIPYDSSLTFLQNIKIMRNIIDNGNEKYCLIGWSIGAVAATFLSNSINVSSIIMINPFYRRSEILKSRDIPCDEEVCVSSTSKQNIKYTIIAGLGDDKIPYTESLRILEYYNLDKNSLFLIEEAKHELSTFPSDIISEIINNNIL